jgi:hypothetical protein
VLFIPVKSKVKQYYSSLGSLSFGEGWGEETKNPNLSIGISL